MRSYFRISTSLASLAFVLGLVAAFIAIGWADSGPIARGTASSQANAKPQWTLPTVSRYAVPFRAGGLQEISLLSTQAAAGADERNQFGNQLGAESGDGLSWVAAETIGGQLEAEDSKDLPETLSSQEVATDFDEGDGGAREAESPEVEAEATPAEVDEAVQIEQQPPPQPPAAPVLPARQGLEISYFVSNVSNVNVTFYDCLSQNFCGHMYGGKIVYEGAAACSWNLLLGTLFMIVGDPTKRVYVCEDRCYLDDTWVDIFWYDPADGWAWQAAVGRYGTIEILVRP